MSTLDRPYPHVNRQNVAFFEALAREELRLQTCADCGHIRFPPAENCPRCLSPRFSWEELSGRGTIWSHIVMHKVYFKSFADEVPYSIVMVQLEEGPLVISNLLDAPEESDLCDRPVEAVFGRDADGRALLQFRITADQEVAS